MHLTINPDGLYSQPLIEINILINLRTKYKYR